jgi:SNF2 family DNA or RNA helicase
MGLVKTFVGAEKMVRLGKRINLVVCQKSKVQDWVDHFNKYYPPVDGVYMYDLTNKKEMQLFLDECEESKSINFGFIPVIGVINYDLIFRRPQFKQLEDFTLMLDESSLIQNEKAKRSKFILNLNPSNIILLSGTPTSGKYENLWSQLHLLGWTISQDTYNKQYINWKLTEDDGSGIRHKIVNKDDPYKNVDRLKQKMREHGAVFMKTEECFDLPEQTFITVNCGSTKEYRTFKKDSIVNIDDFELIGDTTLTKMMYSRMLCGQFNQEKLDAFKDLVESTNDRLIVFYNFTNELNKMVQLVSEMGRKISIVNGQVKDLTAYENESDSITFVQYQAGSMGLNLQKANKIIYFTLPLMSEHFEQSKKRIHRIGQENHCFYYLMICKNTIEEDILEVLNERKNYTDELFRE